MSELKRLIEDIIDDAGISEPTEERHLAESLEKHLTPLFQAVQQHHDAHADDLCVLDDDELYKQFGLSPRDNSVGDPAAMLENCRRFIQTRCKPGGNWVSYKDLEEKIVDVHKMLSNVLRQDGLKSPYDTMVEGWLTKNDAYYMNIRHGNES